MYAEVNSQIFPSLGRFLQLTEDEWTQDLTCEQFFALALAYNDKISGTKRAQQKNKYGNTVYELSPDEKAGLKLAFRAEREADATEESVAAVFSIFCKPEVSEVLAQPISRGEKLVLLHKMAVEKTSAKTKVRNNPVGYYGLISNLGMQLLDNNTQSSFGHLCQELDMLSDLTYNSAILTHYTKDMSMAEKEQAKIAIQENIGTSLEKIYVHVHNSVNARVGFDAYRKICAEEEVV